jgi:hypothetical protein
MDPTEDVEFFEFPMYSPQEKIEPLDTSMRPRTPEGLRTTANPRPFIRRRRRSDTSDLLGNKTGAVSDQPTPDSYPYQYISYKEPAGFE